MTALGQGHQGPSAALLSSQPAPPGPTRLPEQSPSRGRSAGPSLTPGPPAVQLRPPLASLSPSSSPPQQPMSLPSALSPGALVSPWTSLSSCGPISSCKDCPLPPQEPLLQPHCLVAPAGVSPCPALLPGQQCPPGPQPHGRLPSAAPGGSQTPRPRPLCPGAAIPSPAPPGSPSQDAPSPHAATGPL